MVAPAVIETRPAPVATERLLAAATALQRTLAEARLPLNLPGVEDVRVERTRTIEQFADHVLPRLAERTAPVLVVVGGPTGAGKSTLVNSLAGRVVTTPGLLRPTTRSPVLVHHPGDRSWFRDDRILPGLRRVTRAAGDRGCVQLVASPTVPRGIAILDAPDFDSVDDDNRALAAKLIAAADLLLFVTSAARYSDRLSWQHLDLAVERGTSVAIVLNRIPAADHATVVPDLRRMAGARDVTGERVFLVEQAELDDPALLPRALVRPMRTWLDALAADSAARTAEAEQTVTGAVRRAVTVAAAVAEAAARQVDAIGELLTVADRVYAAELDALASALPELLAGLDTRTPVRSPGPDDGMDRTDLAVDLALEGLLLDHAWRAAERASAELRATAHGSALLDWSTEDLSRPGKGLGHRARTAIRGARRRTDSPEADAVGTSTLLGDALAALLTADRDRYLRPVLDRTLAPDASDQLRVAADHAARALARHETRGPIG
ncbi:ABC transporter [Nocardioides carbamazepini]|uniref:GTPase n=1 Tax=Nocardioides carbamazepini TaxID=2854259 RepID=UPI002149B72D|nr:GTPase [Nocardioides carbamazepini]MCR1782013.1 ABC transporter [Nocardioides carbamazepini]